MYLDLTGKGAPSDLDHGDLRRLCDTLSDLLNQSGFYATTRKSAPFDVVVDLRAFTPPDQHSIPSDAAVAALAATGLVVSQDQRTAVARSTTFLINPARYAPSVLSADIRTKIVEAMNGLFYGARTFPDWAPGLAEPVGGARFDWDVLVRTQHQLQTVSQLIPGCGAFADLTQNALVFEGRAVSALDLVVGADVKGLAEGQAQRALLLMPDGRVLDQVVIACTDAERKRLVLVPSPAVAESVGLWLRAVGSGIVEINPGDPHARVFGLSWTTTPIDELPEFVRAAMAERASSPWPPDARQAAALRSDLFDARKPFFIGKGSLGDLIAGQALPAYAYHKPTLPLRRTVLFDQHVKEGAKIVPFAGWEMPVQYPAGIFVEHAATRTRATLFDVSHMSVFDFRGPNAEGFLDLLLANRVRGLGLGRAAYQYLLGPDGVAIDDTYVYRLGPERYMLVVNAANAEADWDWIQAAASGAVALDPDQPCVRLPGPVEIRNLRDAGGDSLLDIAIQGPASRDFLIARADDPETADALRGMKRNDVARMDIAGGAVWVAMTGYTGEPVGFEVFCHPEHAPRLWHRLIETGATPAGLGARDAARLEAGLPLFGHELEGEHAGTLTEAGYGWVARLAKPWFVGRGPYRRRVVPTPGRKLIRLSGKGAKTVREGHRILYDDRTAAGVVTSFAFLDAEMRFVVLAYVNSDFDDSPGRTVLAARIKGDPAHEPSLDLKLVELEILSRFPTKSEVVEWRTHYAS